MLLKSGILLMIIAIFFVIITYTKPSRADESAKDRASALFKEAEQLDAAFELERAAAAYEEALRLDPTLATAIRADQRAKTIRARSEGNYLPLIALERIRRDPKLSSDPQAIDDLVTNASSWPPGLVRVEAWVLASEAYANRLNRPADAVPLRRRILADDKAELVVKDAAAKSLTAYYLAQKDHSSAEEIATLSGNAQLRKDVRRVIRRSRIHLLSIVLPAATFALAVLALVRAKRRGALGGVMARTRGSSKLVLAYAAYVAIVGAILASSYEAGTARPFLFLGAAIAPLLFLARAWGAAGAATAAARAGRALMCAMSALGVAFLVLEGVDVMYLEGLGL